MDNRDDELRRDARTRDELADAADPRLDDDRVTVVRPSAPDTSTSTDAAATTGPTEAGSGGRNFTPAAPDAAMLGGATLSPDAPGTTPR